MAEKLAPEKRHSFIYGGQKVFEWDQTLEEVNIYIVLPSNVPTKMFCCKIQSKHIEVGIKGNPPYLNHDLTCPVKTDSSYWTLEDGTMHITLQKRNKGQTWSSPILGQGQLDPYSADLEQKRLMLQRFQEEICWSSYFEHIQGNKKILAESLTNKDRNINEDFEEAEFREADVGAFNPGFDFSQAQFSGNCPDPRTFMGGIRTD